MTIKETFLNMSPSAIENYCDGCKYECEVNCPFPKVFWKYREDGFCLIRCFQLVDEWIKEDESEISWHQDEIKRLKNRIRNYKKFKELFDKYYDNKT